MSDYDLQDQDPSLTLRAAQFIKDCTTFAGQWPPAPWGRVRCDDSSSPEAGQRWTPVADRLDSAVEYGRRQKQFSAP